MTAAKKRSAAQGSRNVGKAGTGELALIRTIARRAAAAGARAGVTSGARRELQLGIGDDCAIVSPRAGEDLVVTTDFSLEGRHFRRDWQSAQSAGHRTLARGLSDLAAMGARPVAAFLSLALPSGMRDGQRWVGQFLDGLLALAHEAAVPLAGGDTGESPCAHVLADIVLLGAVPAGKALRRSGAQPGDRLYVTGSLGGAAAQLQELQEKGAIRGPKSQTRLISGNGDPHFFPAPRLAVGQWLVRHGRASAAIDISDGLSTDLQHLCVASGVAAVLERAALPLGPQMRFLPSEQALTLALHGGEDYELLFTAPREQRLPRVIAGVAIQAIGEIVAPQRARPRMVLLQSDGRRQRLRPAGWEHLR